MTFRAIHTLDARGNILLALLERGFDVRDAAMRRFIWQTADELSRLLSSKGVEYARLKSALVPQPNKQEIALFFDSCLAESGAYGLHVHRRLIPLLDRRSSHSTCLGDLVGGPGQQAWILGLLDIHLEPSGNPLALRTSNQVYCVYINNVTGRFRETLHQTLRSYPPYLGYADMTLTSHLKTYLSMTLIPGYLQHKGVIIQGHPDEVPAEKDENERGYPFEDAGFVCRSVPTAYYCLLLSYKIECRVLPGNEDDAVFSLNVMADSPDDPSTFEVEIDNAKFDYLQSEKSGTLGRLGVRGAPKASLEALIQGKLQSNYIYNMAFSEDFGVAKFNMMLELEPIDGGDPVRTVAALEYRQEERRLRLITMY